MKKTVFNLVCVLALLFSMTSCYTYTMEVGKGPQTGVEVKKMNTYFIYGLAPGNVSDPKQLAGGATDYRVTIQHTFVDGLIASLTFGIFTPTTTIVTK